MSLISHKPLSPTPPDKYTATLARTRIPGLRDLRLKLAPAELAQEWRRSSMQHLSRGNPAPEWFSVTQGRAN